MADEKTMTEAAASSSKLELTDPDLSKLRTIVSYDDETTAQRIALEVLGISLNRYKQIASENCQMTIVECLHLWRDKDIENNVPELVARLDNASEEGWLRTTSHEFLRRRCTPSVTQELAEKRLDSVTVDCTVTSNQLLESDLSKLIDVIPIQDSTKLRKFCIEYLQLSFPEYDYIRRSHPGNTTEILHDSVQLWHRNQKAKEIPNLGPLLFNILDKFAEEHGCFEKPAYAHFKKLVQSERIHQSKLETKMVNRRRPHQTFSSTGRFQEKEYQPKILSPEKNLSIPYPDYGSYTLTLFKLCPKSIYQCMRGCRKALGQKPPDDLVVLTRMKCNGKISNYYFHFDENCLKKANPNFTMDQIEVSAEIKPHLIKDHILQLQRYYILLPDN